MFSSLSLTKSVCVRSQPGCHFTHGYPPIIQQALTFYWNIALFKTLCGKLSPVGRLSGCRKLIAPRSKLFMSRKWLLKMILLLYVRWSVCSSMVNLSLWQYWGIYRKVLVVKHKDYREGLINYFKLCSVSYLDAVACNRSQFWPGK